MRFKRLLWNAAGIICFGVYVYEISKSIGLLFDFPSILQEKSAFGMLAGVFELVANCLGAAALFYMANWALDTAAKIKVKDYDAAAISIFKSVMSGAVPDFWVYLRPFYITSRMRGRFLVYTGLSGSAPIIYEYELERQLVKITKRSQPIVALGKPGEAIGVGRILTGEDEWRKAASSLMHRAAVIICVPSNRLGTRWELDQIIERGYLQKTVFLMPFKPALDSKGAKSLRQLSSDLRKDWQETVEYMRTRGVAFPDYRPYGLLFHVSPGGTINEEKLDLNSPRGTRRSITRMIKMPPRECLMSTRVGFDL